MYSALPSGFPSRAVFSVMRNMYDNWLLLASKTLDIGKMYSIS
jgi:hypothetical protein